MSSFRGPGPSASTSAAPAPTATVKTVSSVLGPSTYAPCAASAAFGKVLRQSVAAICISANFDTVQPSVLERLTHIASAYIMEICEAARLNTEVAGRTKTIPMDIWLALINMGHNVTALPQFLVQQSGRTVVIPPPKLQTVPPPPVPLHVGRSRLHHPHVHEFLPPFPDPHTYVRTEITVEPEQSYERARELLAEKKRNADNSLVDFMQRTHPCTCLFPDLYGRLREEARQIVADRKLNMAARRVAHSTQSMANNHQPIGTDLPDDVTADDDVEMRDTTAPSSSMDDEDFEFENMETETSIIRRRMGIHCFLLDPTNESRPYISALVNNDETYEESEKTDKESVRVITAASNRNENEEQSTDNPFLRPARLPFKPQ